jgi:hypothetical protein
LVVLVGLTLEYGAGQAIWLGRRGSRLPQLSASGLARPIFRVPLGTSLGEARRRAERAGAAHAALAVADPDGGLLALVHEPAAADAPDDVVVDTLARDVGPERTISAGLRGADVLRAVQRDPLGEYLVMSGQDVVGVLTAADVARVLRRGRRDRAAPRETSA